MIKINEIEIPFNPSKYDKQVFGFSEDKTKEILLKLKELDDLVEDEEDGL